MKYIPKKIPEGINSPKEHPLKDLAILIVSIFGICAVIYLGLGLFSDKIADLVSPEMEIKIGQQIMDRFSKDKKVVNGDDNKRIQTLVANLWQPYESTKVFKFPTRIDDSSELNAFIGPGGIIWVTQGLLDATESENELAFVLCHELGHLKHRHVLKKIGRGLILLFFESIFSFSGGTGIEGLGFQLAELKYSREKEHKADEFALDCMYRKYQSFKDYDSFFKKLKKKHKNRIYLEYLSTHPATEDRLTRLKQLVENYN